MLAAPTLSATNFHLLIMNTFRLFYLRNISSNDTATDAEAASLALKLCGFVDISQTGSLVIHERSFHALQSSFSA